jgi:hypothetical protein
MVYTIDRVDSGIAVCENLETGKSIEIAMTSLPKGAKEGDVIRKDGDGYIIDSALTEQRKTELSDRLDRLFKKHNG